jgi:glycerol-3-phosphate dehydrogenase (NAD(P)+)
MQHIGVIGAGAWGTALAAVARAAGRAVTLWAREPEVAAAIRDRRENPTFLPGIALDPAIRATEDLAEAARGDALLLAVPAQHLGGVAADLASHLPAVTPLVVCAKGIETRTRRLMTEVLAETLPDQPRAVLSGPTFAAEVARGRPSAVTVAATDAALAAALTASLGSRNFRPYASDDPIGVQIGGAIKNVIAIACGIVAGRGLGENARAALITRGLAELSRLGTAQGGQPATFAGLSGLGDLTLTCTSPASRNYALGQALADGTDRDAALAGRPSVAEGAYTAEAAVAMAAERGVDLPICAAVDAVLNRDAAIEPTIAALLARPFKAEGGGPDVDMSRPWPAPPR